MHQEFNDLYSTQDYVTVEVDINSTTIIDSLFSSIVLSCSVNKNYLLYKEQNSENWKKTCFEKSHAISSKSLQKNRILL